MLRKALGVLLVISWIIVSGFDLLEDLHFPSHSGVNIPKKAALPGVGQPVNLVNDNLERGSRTLTPQAGLFKLPIVQNIALRLFVNASTVSKKAFRIHKLHRVFLI